MQYLLPGFPFASIAPSPHHPIPIPQTGDCRLMQDPVTLPPDSTDVAGSTCTTWSLAHVLSSSVRVHSPCPAPPPPPAHLSRPRRTPCRPPRRLFLQHLDPTPPVPQRHRLANHLQLCLGHCDSRPSQIHPHAPRPCLRRRPLCPRSLNDEAPHAPRHPVTQAH
jgi:hypothetical protein